MFSALLVQEGWRINRSTSTFFTAALYIWKEETGSQAGFVTGILCDLT
jgi:hypothetical protein